MRTDWNITFIFEKSNQFSNKAVLSNVITISFISSFHNQDFKFMGKIWGVWCKGVQSSMMGELK